MRSLSSSRAGRWIAAAGVVTVLVTATPLAGAQEQPGPTALTLSPESDTAPAGTCNEFTARVTGSDQVPVGGATVDVRQVLVDAGTEPGETRELAFCNPVDPSGANPTGQGGTSFGDVSGNNEAATAGLPGRHTSVHGEVGPTNANGEVTFGITINQANDDDVTVTAWFEFEDDDAFSETDLSDESTKTWAVNEQPPVTSLDAAPESASASNGGQHQVTVTMATVDGPAAGIVPGSLILPDATGRPAGDAAAPNAGASPNAGGPGYSCTPSDAQGVSTCTFQDPAGTGAGTDTVAFFVDTGAAGLQEADVQDAAQVTWMQPLPPPSTPTPSTPTPTPTPAPATPEARNVRLCHEAASPTTCDVAPAILVVGNEHTVAALVTDRLGNTVAGVPVELRVSGAGAFEPSGVSSVLVTTASDGVALATLTSESDGVSTIVAEIAPPGTAGGFRGPAANDDECEQPAGANGVPAAGNCVSQAVQVTWVEDAAECDDGLDNDDDSLVDLEDPGCTSGDDDSELPVHTIDPPLVPHDRRINMRFRDWVGPGDEGLVIFGRVRLADDEDNFRRCTQAQPVRIQRRIDGDWKTIKHATTNARGRYAGVVFDKPGPHRAVAVRTELFVGDVLHVCRRVEIEKPHNHRR